MCPTDGGSSHPQSSSPWPSLRPRWRMPRAVSRVTVQRRPVRPADSRVHRCGRAQRLPWRCRPRKKKRSQRFPQGKPTPTSPPPCGRRIIARGRESLANSRKTHVGLVATEMGVFGVHEGHAWVKDGWLRYLPPSLNDTGVHAATPARDPATTASSQGDCQLCAVRWCRQRGWYWSASRSSSSMSADYCRNGRSCWWGIAKAHAGHGCTDGEVAKALRTREQVRPSAE